MHVSHTVGGFSACIYVIYACIQMVVLCLSSIFLGTHIHVSWGKTRTSLAWHLLLKAVSTMSNKPVVIHLILSLFQIQSIYTYDDDEYYCQGVYDSYSYCRRCPSARTFCEAPKSCQCENIELYNNHCK